MNVYKELRKEKGLTQIELSKLFSIDQTTVSKWELGKAVPDVATLCRLADFFDVSVDYLLGRTTYYYPDGVRTTAPMHEALTPEVHKVVEQYCALPEQLRKIIRQQLDVFSSPEELLSKTDKKV